MLGTRLAIGFALVLAFFALAPSAASASTGPGVIELEGPDLSALPLLTLGVSALSFGMLDLVYATRGEPLPLALSIVQIAVAGVLMPAFMLSSYGFRELEGGDQAVLGAFGGLNIAWFIGHGFVQLRARDEANRRASDAARRDLTDS